MRLDWRQIVSFYQRLSPRERLLLGLTSGVVLVLALYSFVWEPLVEGRARLARQIAFKEQQLQEIQRMRVTYMELLSRLEAGKQIIASPEEGFSLFPHIEATVSQVVTRDHIAAMNPDSKIVGNTYREESVELKLINITLDQLVDMLYRIEKGPQPLRVTKLSVKKRPRDPHQLDVTATVSMLKAVQT